LGYNAGANLTAGNNNIDIGNGGVAAEANTIRIGTSGTQTATFIAGIRGVAIAGAQPVGVNANGQLGIRASSARFKEAITPMDKTSEAILSLQPVAFRYKKELDPAGVPQFGLVAEQVAKVNPDLVARDDQGKPFTVRYDEVNAMLLNEFLKEHHKVEEQEARIIALESADSQEKEIIVRQKKDFEQAIAQQREEIATLSARLDGQAASIQKVSAQLETSGPAPQVVNNP
jgi:hypothetical protein